MSVSVVYRDVDFQIKKDVEDARCSGDIRTDYSDLSLMKFVANPSVRKATLEQDFWRLDGSYDIMNADDNNFAVFSEGISSETQSAYGYALSYAVNVDYVFIESQTISKLTFTFDSPDYCSHMIVEGFSDKGLKNSVFQKTYYPNESFYNCDLEGNFDVLALRFTFLAMNKPNRFFRLYGVDFGISHVFDDEFVYSVSVLEQTSLISQQLYIGTSDISLKSASDMFKKYKPIFIYKNGKLEQTHFISNVDKSGFNRVELECADVLFLLNDFGYSEGIQQEQVYSIENPSGITYLSSKYDTRIDAENNMIGYEGAYNLDSTIKDVIDELQQGTLFKIYSDENASSIGVSGYYEGKNKKNLLNEIVFANQCIIKITPTGQLKIYKQIPTNIKSVSQNRIFSNFSKKTVQKTNAISLSIYNYEIEEKQIELEGDYYYSRTVSEEKPIFFRYARSGAFAGASITITFYSDYSFRYRIESNNENTNSSADIYYFIVTDTQQTEIIHLDEINANNTINLATISNISFINEGNKQALIDALSEYYSHNSTFEFDMIIEDEELGDMISVEVDEKAYIGRLEKIEYTMQGKKIANVIMRVYDEV